MYPSLGGDKLWIVDKFPAAQAMLARLDPDDPTVAERFEVFLHGVELANGFRELRDPAEQAIRFATDRKRRQHAGIQDITPDPQPAGGSGSRTARLRRRCSWPGPPTPGY